jgi:hypothetical protein
MDAAALMKRVLLPALLLLSIHAAAAAAPPVYRVIDIGFLPRADSMEPGGLNNTGVVVGTAYLAPYGIRAFVWTEATGARRLPVPASGRDINNNALDVNDRNQAIGYVPDGGPLGEGGEAIWNPDGSYTYFLYGTWADGRPGSGIHITNGGKVLGNSLWRNNYDRYPWVWSPEQGFIDISAIARDGFSVYQMNDRGRVVGRGLNCYLLSATAFAYEVETQKLRWLDPDYLTCRSSTATAVNEAGDVVGWADVLGVTRPFLWNENDGLRMLSGSVPPDWVEVNPTDINSTKQVVGRFSRDYPWLTDVYFYWDEASGFHDLRHLLDPDDPMSEQVVLSDGKGIVTAIHTPKINDRGMILVAGSLRSDRPVDRPRRTFLLVPVTKE